MTETKIHSHNCAILLSAARANYTRTQNLYFQSAKLSKKNCSHVSNSAGQRSSLQYTIAGRRGCSPEARRGTASERGLGGSRPTLQKD
jgi:hypothetical protein